MVAKLVVWGTDRESAIARLRRALQEYHVGGIATTLSLFRVLVEMDAFLRADYHTAFLDELLEGRRLEELHRQQDPEAEEAAVVAAACLATLAAQNLPDAVRPSGKPSLWWQEGLRVQHGRLPR